MQTPLKTGLVVGMHNNDKQKYNPAINLHGRSGEDSSKILDLVFWGVGYVAAERSFAGVLGLGRDGWLSPSTIFLALGTLPTTKSAAAGVVAFHCCPELIALISLPHIIVTLQGVPYGLADKTFLRSGLKTSDRHPLCVKI